MKTRSLLAAAVLGTGLLTAAVPQVDTSDGVTRVPPSEKAEAPSPPPSSPVPDTAARDSVLEPNTGTGGSGSMQNNGGLSGPDSPSVAPPADTDKAAEGSREPEPSP